MQSHVVALWGVGGVMCLLAAAPGWQGRLMLTAPGEPWVRALLLQSPPMTGVGTGMAEARHSTDAGPALVDCLLAHVLMVGWALTRCYCLCGAGVGKGALTKGQSEDQ